jgi:hypothetical protein
MRTFYVRVGTLFEPSGWGSADSVGRLLFEGWCVACASCRGMFVSILQDDRRFWLLVHFLPKKKEEIKTHLLVKLTLAKTQLLRLIIYETYVNSSYSLYCKSCLVLLFACVHFFLFLFFSFWLYCCSLFCKVNKQRLNRVTLINLLVWIGLRLHSPLKTPCNQLIYGRINLLVYVRIHRSKHIVIN